MKYCSNCGTELNDDTLFCPKCGTKCEPHYEQNAVPNQEVVGNTTSNGFDKDCETMYLVGFILNIITTIATGWLLIPLAWCLPMTIRSYRAYKNHEFLSIAFGVCTLIFLNQISGILYLVADSKRIGK